MMLPPDEDDMRSTMEEILEEEGELDDEALALSLCEIYDVTRDEALDFIELNR